MMSLRYLLHFMLWALAASSATARAQDFPQSFSHAYGEMRLEQRPERVVSLGYVGHDDILALGVVPVALRHWFGDFPNGVWPWAEAALGGAAPVVLRGRIAFEQVAALAPDVIIAIGSGISAADYAILSQIAPTIASEAQYGAYGTPWEVQALTIGRALGRLGEAEARVAEINGRFAALRAAHPDWQGSTGVAAFYWAGTPGAFAGGDTRAGVLSDLGFVLPPQVPDAGATGFFAELSPEDLSALDADLLVWVASDGSADALAGLSLRRTLRAHREGREVFADLRLAGAMAHATLLSLPYVLDRLVPEIAAAMDGDPATPVPSAVAAGIAP